MSMSQIPLSRAQLQLYTMNGIRGKLYNYTILIVPLLVKGKTKFRIFPLAQIQIQL